MRVILQEANELVDSHHQMKIDTLANALTGFDWQPVDSRMIYATRRLGTTTRPDRMGNNVKITFLPQVLKELDNCDAQRNQVIGEKTFILLKTMLEMKSLNSDQSLSESINVDTTVLDL